MEAIRDLPEELHNLSLDESDPQIKLISEQIIGVPQREIERVFRKHNGDIVTTIVELGMRRQREQEALEADVRQQRERDAVRKSKRK